MFLYIPKLVQFSVLLTEVCSGGWLIKDSQEVKVQRTSICVALSHKQDIHIILPPETHTHKA